MVSVSRYISLRAPEGLPLPLWAGNAVGPTGGYPDLFPADESGAAQTPSDGTVQLEDGGGARLSWEQVTHGVTSAISILLDSDHLPVRIEIVRQRNAGGG